MLYRSILKQHMSPWTETPWNIMTKQGILCKLISLTMACEYVPKYRVLITGELSEAFLLRARLRQGNELSPVYSTYHWREQ